MHTNDEAGNRLAIRSQIQNTPRLFDNYKHLADFSRLSRHLYNNINSLRLNDHYASHRGGVRLPVAPGVTDQKDDCYNND